MNLWRITSVKLEIDSLQAPDQVQGAILYRADGEVHAF